MLILVGIVLMLIEPKYGIIVMILGVIEAMARFMIAKGKLIDSVASESSCKQHTWNYDANGFLFCSVCKKVPGQQDPSDDRG